MKINTELTSENYWARS